MEATGRQYYFMDIAKNYVETALCKKGSPLTFHITTFSCQMSTARSSEACRYLRASVMWRRIRRTRDFVLQYLHGA